MKTRGAQDSDLFNCLSRQLPVSVVLSRKCKNFNNYFIYARLTCLIRPFFENFKMKWFHLFLVAWLVIFASLAFGRSMDDFVPNYSPLSDQCADQVPNYVLRTAQKTKETSHWHLRPEVLAVAPKQPLFFNALHQAGREVSDQNAILKLGDSMASVEAAAFLRAIGGLLSPTRTGQDLYYYLMGLVQFENGQIELAKSSFNTALMVSVGPGTETVRLKTLLSLFELERRTGNHLLALEYMTEYQKTFARIKERDTVTPSFGQIDSLVLPPTSQAQNTLIAQHWVFYIMLILLLLLLFTTALLFRDKLSPLLWLKSRDGLNALIESQVTFDGLDRFKWPESLPFKPEESDDETIKIDEDKIEKLIKLRGMRLLTEDEWDDFKVIFDTIYPDLFIRLVENRKSLTLTDEKVVCLLRLHCNTQEIAARMGISQNSANTARSRLRKRLGLEHHEYIEEFLLRHSSTNSFDERFQKRRG